ncbi:MAG: CHASE2 domain-containing protein [Spirochaetaceae bacterium]|nr:MAG: CHASE2 domain-containing protein [Spirochaetaceae bacterium]
MVSIHTLSRARALLIALALVVTGAISLLNQFSWYQVIESRVFDRMLWVLPESPTDDTITVVAIDDRALERVGEWPWSRAVLADGLVTVAEFSPHSILLDIELSEQSPWLVERGRWQRIAAEYPQAVPRSVLDEVLIDRDKLLAESVEALGNVYIPVTVEEGDVVRLRSAIPIIRRAAAGEGFVNQKIDADGVSRHVELLRRIDGELMMQLGAAVLGLRPSDPERLEFNEMGRLMNSSASFTTESGDTLRIPFNNQGEMIIRWPRSSFAESFHQFSWATLIEYQEAIADLEFNLRIMDEAGYLDQRSQALLQTANAAADTLAIARASGNPTLLGEYRRLRQAFIALAGGFLQGGAQQQILDDLRKMAEGDIPDSIANQLADIVEDVNTIFPATREIYQEVEQLRRFLDHSLASSRSMVGYTATSTTDLGVTPFDAEFPNLGLHGTVMSMMRNGSFIQRGSWILSWVLGTIWMLAVAVVVGYSSGQRSLAFALAGITLPIVIVAVVLRLTSYYLPIVSFMLPVVVVSLAVLARNYLDALRDRQVIRATFEHYLAPEVINELVEHPDRIGVGGQEKQLTALFTDIVGFSRISEILGTADVVALLNEYLTEMSDVIIDHRGTIDKYEGDAIMAFFGAPLMDDSHAEQACRAAIQMKRVETLLNDRLVRNGTAPRALITRIGVNTGSMIVGNLGTNRRLNYTVMGPAVNLAARLEGINKQYGTAMCVSELTYTELPPGFLLRRMDRVRVHGIDDPVRLYELIGYSAESSAPLREALEIFERGLSSFEQREWGDARNRFETVLRIYSDDGPSKLFVKRCDQFLNEEPRDTWDGVINLTEK